MRLSILGLSLAACTGVSSDPGHGELVTQTGRWASGLALQGNDIYFVAGATTPYELRRVAKLGGTPEPIATGTVIDALTSDAHGLYWLQNDQGTTTVRAWSPGDVSSRVLFSNPNWGNGNSYENLVSDDVAVYYADLTGAVWRIPEAGSGAAQIATTNTSGGAVALAPGALWVATLTGAMRIPIAGGSPTMLTLGDRPSEIAWDDNLLFVNYSGSGDDDGYLESITADGTVSKIASHLVLPGSVIASQGNLYFSTGNNDAAVRRVPYGGGPTDALAVGKLPGWLTIDDTDVYWTDLLSGELRRIRR